MNEANGADKERQKAEKQKIKKEKRRLRSFKAVFNILRGVYYVCLSLLFPFKRYGNKRRFNDREYIFVSNHLSRLDVFPCALATSKPVHFICKKQLENSAAGRWVVKMCQCIPVSRDGTDVGAVMQSIRYLKNGESLAIFPEGTRNKTDDIFLPFKSGAAMISIKTKTPIVPVVMAKKMRIFRRVRIFYGDPIEFTDYYDKKLTAQDIENCDSILKEKMIEMYREVNGGKLTLNTVTDEETEIK